MPSFPEDMRKTVKVQLRLSEKAAEVLRKIASGERSKWISDLIWRNRRKVEQAEEMER